MNDWELLIKTSIIIKLHLLNKWQSLNASWPETTKTVVIMKVKTIICTVPTIHKELLLILSTCDSNYSMCGEFKYLVGTFSL